MSSTAQNNRISRSETTGEFPWKKSVRWSDKLVEVRYYEKPFRKGSYGELSQRLGKPVRVPVKAEEKQDNSCICT